MPSEAFERGLQVRREVLGNEYVDRALTQVNDFNRPVQELVTEVAWGTIWTRPGLPRKTRSLINLAMITALNRPQELRTHVRGAVNNGCTKEEIQEVLLQAFVYCGAPAGMDAFRAASEVIAEMEANK
ncbi:MAG: 4-carboxymuconolactone decarboxylase [Chloroflexi bacterium]|nr:4-carboxymuconolactone decarboxylase [Chloroflexota bacterium]